MSEVTNGINLLKNLQFIRTEDDLGTMTSLNIKMIARIARRHAWLRDRVAKMSSNGADASWDKSEMSALGWAIETLLRTLSSVEKGNSL